MNRKQLIYLFIGAVGVLLIFVVFLAFQQSSQTAKPKITAAGVTPAPTSAGVEKTIDGGTRERTASPTSVPQQNLNAVQTAQAFYNSTLNGNPLLNGKYKTNPYLADSFKSNIGDYYDEGNRPVFCAKNHKAQVTIGKEKQQYYDQGYLTQEFVTDSTTGKDLYIIILENDNNIWHIFDVTCL